MIKAKQISSIDKEIGQRLWQLRKTRGLTQKDLAERLGISFQQLQKYENGINRLSVSRAVEIAKALNTSVISIFKNFLDENTITSDLRKDQAKLLTAFDKIPDPEVRFILNGLIKALAKNQPQVSTNA